MLLSTDVLPEMVSQTSVMTCFSETKRQEESWALPSKTIKGNSSSKIGFISPATFALNVLDNILSTALRGNNRQAAHWFYGLFALSSITK
ncbi:hypothetical protein Pst134EA_032111 [Puccinia striiformis f. sp. tritici]|uniref:uncharacterized protein n=1 Tax=Puccinia striiformis f. sp. tritici TaxID=168172 RepID=UPI0020088643|nr:uncharacterized protein Pst134EA_032111 [Puccinia striiformis f. sp. tritici]KAH9441884.1 hypothetical protein Pst134EA_032111 [Puccinia striiformis f. sp. tritici]